MLSIKLLKKNIAEVKTKLATRGFELNVSLFEKLEQQRKQLQVHAQQLQEKRNQQSKLIGQQKAKGESCDTLLEAVSNISKQTKQAEKELAEIQTKLTDFLLNLPNIPHSTVPIGMDETANVEVRRWGKPKTFSFKIKDHADLGESLGYMDFSCAAKITGSRFVVLHGPLARLQRALTQFMLDKHTQENTYQEIYVPYMANRASFTGTGQLPKFIDDQFSIGNDQEYWLIPTAEVPVTNVVRDTVLSEQRLPLKFVCHTPCFRRESGSYGKDTRGMIRQHQFEKVELVKIVNPASSYNELESLTRDAESILKALALPYRIVSLSTGDLGFSSAKTYDLEVWLPSENRYREISSCSNFEDFQARRMQARFKDAGGKVSLVHTLNGSGIAVGRALVALMENYQDEAGNIHVPEVLKPYMNNLNVIKKVK